MKFLHSGNLGDIVYAMPTIQALCKARKEKAEIYLKPFVKASYYPGAFHPCGPYRMTADGIKFIIPLLEAQEYVEKATGWAGEKIDVNLDDMRELKIDFGRGHIPRWYFLLSAISADLSQPWLKSSALMTRNVVINRSLRYRNNTLDYNFLKNYKPVHFVGLEEEYVILKRDIPDLEWVQTKTAQELAEVIYSAKLFIGNQSFPFSVAEGLKVKRILEVCPFCPNVIPHGEHAYDVLLQSLFEVIVDNVLGDK